MSVASGFTYRVVEGWEQVPEGFTHKDVVGVGVDSKDRVYLLTRSDPRVIVYDRDGSFVTSWAEGLFTNRTHGIRMGPDDSVFCVDDGDHTVRKFSPSGELLLTLGTKGEASDSGYDKNLANADLWDRLMSIKRGAAPFNRPTNISVAPDGELYVCDGYGNARVHRFTADGKLIQSWGEPGTGPGEFYLPHDVWVLEDGRVLVADRENDRIQIFNREGVYQSEWTHLQRPTGIFIRDGLIYVSELSRRKGMRSFRLGEAKETLPGRVSILDLDGKLIYQWGGPDMAAAGNFYSPHTVCADSHGDLYVGEVVYTDWISKGLAPEGSHSFQKFEKVTG